MSVLADKVEKHVVNLLRTELSPKFLYHNLSHTLRVVQSTKELIKAENIEGDDAEDLIISAWFHDVGYTKGCEKHEEEGAKMARIYLDDINLKPERIDHICKLIMATKLGYEPENNLEKIIKDADNSHFGSKDYADITELLREEWEQIDNNMLTNSEWAQSNIVFFTSQHRFYTKHALKKWQQVKDKNLSSLYKNLKKEQKEEQKQKVKHEELTLKKNKAKLPERGIETMFRVTFRNHMTLSNIADSKANILLSVNSIIISLVLANLVSKLDNPKNDHLIIPTIIFVIFTVASVILSVLATRPNVTRGKFSKTDVKQKKINLLFFGNFHKMDLDEFEWGMGEMMKDRDYLYSSMKKDLYFLGKVLHKKYRLLRLTYGVFAVGIIVSVISFYVAMLIHSKKQNTEIKDEILNTTSSLFIQNKENNDDCYYC